jgi:ABC-2 type transport system ATP-binding protein
LSICGIDTARPTGQRLARRQTGYLPQYFGYFPRFTVVEFVEYVAWLKGVPGRQLRARSMAAIKEVDLESRSNEQLRRLSGGMLRRVGIAQAIVHKPALVVLDEPTGGLDPQQRIQFRTFIRGLEGKSTALISTHMVEDVHHLAAHVLVLADGEIEFSGSPAELIAEATEGAEGDTALERGYASVLARRSAR